MGTNYYVVEGETCPTCGHGKDKRMHIGKSSHGWCFSLHVGSVEEPDVPRNLEEWRAKWTDMRIEDEYGDVYTPEEMERVILERGTVRIVDVGWFTDNYAIPGPNNLARHRIGDGCVGHGDGTYDLIIGQFC